MKASCLVLAGLLWLGGAPAGAQPAAQPAAKDYPNHPIRMVVPYVAGGPMDFIGRTLGQKMAPTLGQNFFIDNRAGAGGAIGTAFVAKSAPDGYTLLNTSSSYASLPVVVPALGYDPLKDLSPITLVARSVGFVVAVGPSVKAASLQDFIADAKAQPDKFNYGSAGVGNVMHFAAEFFNASAGTRIKHVPYKGVAEAMNDLMAGRIDLCIGSATALLPLVKSGKLRALAITGKARWALLPDVPTVDEAGVKGFAYTPWYGLWYPTGTPAAYVGRMRDEVVRALADPEVQRAFAEQGYVTVGSTPAEFAKTIDDEIELNKRLATRINFAAP